MVGGKNEKESDREEARRIIEIINKNK